MSRAIDIFVRTGLYPAPGITIPDPPAPFQDVELPLVTEQFAGSVHGWFAPGENSRRGAPAIVYFHGNGENLETVRQTGLLDRLRNLGASLLLIDYPGYGKSEGNPCEETLSASAEAALVWMSLRSENQPVVSMGWSMGSALAVHVANKHPRLVDGLVLLSPWARLDEVAKMHYPTWLGNFLSLKEQYDSENLAPKILCPAFVSHGMKDATVPASQGLRVAAKLNQLWEWLPIPDADHRDIFYEDALWFRLKAFLARLV